MAAILIVEDDGKALEILALLVQKKFGVTVHTAEDGQAGLEAFRSHAPDLVITDINMPNMDGIETAREIKSISPDARFIVLTAYSDRNYLQRFSEVGFVQFLTKPIDFPRLFETIASCLG